ncbi:MAG: replication protein [Oscillospiraceae bacterium]|nr:replication protein [Oscillospiraceae bacterium]
MSSKPDTKSRKYQLTFNNPSEHADTHESINNRMKELSYLYYCLCDEIGEKENTPHTHLYFVCKNAVHFTKVKKLFPTAHIESAKGSSSDNRDYIRKEGRYAKSAKKETNIPETFEEYGEMPLDKSEKNETVSAQILQMIKDGYINTEIIDKFPSCYSKIPHLDKMRQEYLDEKFGNERRKVEVVYIYGFTGTGKTRYVMDMYGYRNVCKITNYSHPFDNYKIQDVILFDEFRDSIPISDMLQYLDCYPCLLPARYADKVACFTYMLTLIPSEKRISLRQCQVHSVRSKKKVLEKC